MAEVLVRRDIWSLEDEGPWHPFTLAYARGVAVMQGRHAGDSTSWAGQAAIHGSSTGDWREQCQHHSWYFLPWHRLYLYWFEQIVRAALQEAPDVDEDVRRTWTLPYWNYTRGDRFATLPEAFRQKTLPDATTPNPLFVPDRNAFINDGEALSEQETDISAALAQPQFEQPAFTGGFGGAPTGRNHFSEDPDAQLGAVEQTPHNDVHVAVGGLMADFDTAGLDPVFWMHHANIDRLWSVWRGEDDHANPQDQRWSGERFRFTGPTGAQTETAVADAGDTESVLGYTYEDVAPPAVAPRRRRRIGMTSTPPPEHAPELVGASDQHVELTGDEARVEFAIEEPTGPARRGIAGDEEDAGRVYLNIEGVEGTRNPGVVYGVYLNLPGEGASEPERHYVGNVSFFGIEKAGDVSRDDAHGLRYAFEITDVVDDLREAGTWDPRKVTVTFAPLRRAERRGAAGAPPPVRIGRVALYVQ